MPFSSIGDWDLIKEQVESQITKIERENIIFPQCTEQRSVDKSNIVEVVRQDSVLALYNITESEEIQADAYTNSRDTVQIKEYGVAPRIKQRYIDDASWDIVSDVIGEMGRAFAVQKNTDFIAALAAGVTAANTIPAVAAWGLGAAAPLTDISQGLEALQDDEYGQDPARVFIILNPENIHYLRILAALYSMNIYGPGASLQNPNGIMPVVFGMPVLSTTRCPNTRMFLVDKAVSSVIYYEREPIKIEKDAVLRLRSLDIVAYARFAFYVRIPDAVALVQGI